MQKSILGMGLAGFTATTVCAIASMSSLPLPAKVAIGGCCATIGSTVCAMLATQPNRKKTANQAIDTVAEWQSAANQTGNQDANQPLRLPTQPLRLPTQVANQEPISATNQLIREPETLADPWKMPQEERDPINALFD